MTEKNILIVDDDPDFRANLEDILVDEGYTLFAVGLCSEALEVVRKHEIKAALLDLKLPDGSGTQLLSDLKQVTQDCVCAVMTGFADIDSAIDAMRAGAFHYLRKPVNPLDLLKFLENVFETIQLRSEKRIAEMALKENEQLMRSLLNAFPSAAFLLGTDGSLLAGNQAVADALGKDIDKIAGESILDLIPDSSAEFRQRKGIEVVDSGKTVRFEEKIVEKYFDTTINPIFGDDGQVNRLAVFSRDITASKLAEEETRRLQIQLAQSQKMEAIGTLAGGIAHDFNNILSAIIGYADLIKSWGASENDRIDSGLDQILRAGNRAKDLVNQILAFSRPTRHNKIPVQITTIVKEVLKFLRSSMPTTIELRHDFEPGPKIIEVDPTHIHQVLMNLCTNSGHAMQDKGGILEIGVTSVMLEPDTTDEFPEMSLGSYVKLTVKDSGCGIEPEILENIFDPYFTTKELGKGTGLGLSVVHGIVKSYSGAIKVTSALGKGTLVTILFPQVEGEAEVKTPSQAPAQGTKEHILLVDDEVPLIQLNKQILEHLNYTVTTRTSSVEALEAFQANPNKFDLVITDMTMPNMTGDILTRELLKVRPDLPIIICTGFSESLTKAKSKQMGAKKMLMKPVITSELAKAIRTVLDES
jgi:PAS domain S-box-containing protein